jgi:EpsD family peptidyl-prolyl cis-trans isomerase
MINTIKNHDVSRARLCNGATFVGARLLAISALLCLAVAGCGDNKQGDATAAAIVNGEVLSAAELKMKLSQYDHLPAERKSAAAGTLLKSMVDMELLRQAAIKDKLDADEAIRARIDSSTRMILAEAYLTKQGAAVAKPTDSDIKAYFDQNPELYSDRKVFEMDELMVKVRPEDAAEIKEKFADGKNYNEFVAWLAEKKVPNNTQPVSAAAEDMPRNILGKLRDVKAGDVLTLEGQGQFSVIRVHAVHSQPMTLEQAKPAIEEKLYKQRRTEAMDSMFKQLREKAKIEYVAPYSESGIAAVKPK